MNSSIKKPLAAILSRTEGEYVVKAAVKKFMLGISVAIALLVINAWAEPGGTYTLTGEEKRIEEIIKADMAQFPDLYRGVDIRSYIAKFKRENKIGRKKHKPGDQLQFPHTLTSLRLKSAAKKDVAQDSVVKEEKPEEANELPLNFKLRDPPVVVQEGSYCVPASGEVIARFHGIKTDQYEIAKLSSQNSMDHGGTNPLDMARAMENFGFRYRQIKNKHTSGDVDDYMEKTLPQFKEALVREGPMYISFLAGIFGDQGHGCVVIGYSDTKKEMYFYNPWGREYSAPYREVEKYTRSVIAFTPPKLLGDAIVDCTLLIETLKQVAPSNARNVVALRNALDSSNVSFEFIECNRVDTMDDEDKTERLARREGQKFIDLALERAPAILIPQTNGEGETDYMFVRKSLESKKKLLVQRIGPEGWGAPELSSSRLLVRCWTTPVGVQWLLPLFEFSGKEKDTESSEESAEADVVLEDPEPVQLPPIKNRDKLSQEELEAVLAAKKESAFTSLINGRKNTSIQFLGRGTDTKILVDGSERVVQYSQNMLMKNSLPWYKWEIDDRGRLILFTATPSGRNKKTVWKLTVSINDEDKLLMAESYGKKVYIKED